MTKLDELHTKPFREFLLSNIFMTLQSRLIVSSKETFNNLPNNCM